MDQPLVYFHGNRMQMDEMERFMGKYLKLKKFGENTMILDVGSGDGAVTKMFRKLVGNVKLLMGIDVSEVMVKFAESSNVDGNVKFAVANVEVEEDFEEFYGVFDYVFSSFCLHWARNQRQVWKNLHSVLKPGGQVCAVFVHETSIYSVYATLAKRPKFSAYLVDCEKYFPPYLFAQDPLQDLAKNIKLVGFQVEVCEIVERTHVYEDVEAFTKFVNAIDPFTGKMPKNLVEEYLDEFMIVFAHQAKMNSYENAKSVTLPYKVFHVIATRHIDV